MVAEIIIGLLFLFIVLAIVNKFLTIRDKHKEKVFIDILNGHISLEIFNTGKYEEYTIVYKDKPGEVRYYTVWANSEYEATILFLTETGESYLRILKITQ